MIAVSLYAIVRQMRPSEPPSPKKAWYYDLNTRKLFSRPVGKLPPIAAPSGPLPDGSPAGVRAYVFGCDGCSKSKRFIAYLETYTAKAREFQTALTQTNYPPLTSPMQPGQGILIKRPESSDWVDRTTQEAQIIIAETSQRCGPGKFPRQCFP